jgi:hypothetical protein
MKWLLMAIMFSVASLANAALPNCEEFAREKILVGDFYNFLHGVVNDSEYPMWAARVPPMEEMLKEPVGSSCWLIREIKEIRREHLTLQQARASRTIWAIRALRYMTRCTDFREVLMEKRLLDPTTPRWQFLLRGGVLNVPFFATWPSRDSVMLAPLQVQREVVAEWQEWYASQAATFHFGECEDVDDWYN